jgi:hypothetical protein
MMARHLNCVHVSISAVDRYRFVVDRHLFVLDWHRFVVDRHRFVVDLHRFVVDRHRFAVDRHRFVVDRHHFVVDRHRFFVDLLVFLWTGIVLMPIRIPTFYSEADPVSDPDSSKKLGQVHNCQILRLQKSTAA